MNIGCEFRVYFRLCQLHLISYQNINYCLIESTNQ